jgi:hypothetical protein
MKGDGHFFIEFILVRNRFNKGFKEFQMVHGMGKTYLRRESLRNLWPRCKRGPSTSDMFLNLFQLIINVILSWTSIYSVTGTLDRRSVSRIIWARLAWWHLECFDWEKETFGEAERMLHIFYRIHPLWKEEEEVVLIQLCLRRHWMRWWIRNQMRHWRSRGSSL